MARQVYQVEFTLDAKESGSYAPAFSKAQARLRDLQQEINISYKLQKDISAYEKQNEAIGHTANAIKLLQAEHDNLQKELDETEKFSASLSNAKLRVSDRIEKTTLSMERQDQKLKSMEAALREAGIETKELADAKENLRKNLESTRAEQEKTINSTRGFTEAALGMQDVLVALGAFKGLQAVGRFFAGNVREAAEYEAALTGVAKTTDLTAGELAAISREIKDLSGEIPVSAVEIAKIAENAGQLGISQDYIMEFTRVMADLGVATNLTGDEAAMTFAKFANITGMAQSDFDSLGSTVVMLGNNLATTERDIADMATRLASAGKQAGMSEADILGLAGALSSVGLEAQAGGTAFSKSINRITVAVETGNADLAEFARVAGMSAQEFADAWRGDAAGAMVSFTEGLADVERHGRSTVVLLDELGLTEIRLSDAMRRAAGSGDLFRNSIEMGNRAWRENIALTEEAGLFYGTTQSQLIKMQNECNRLQVAIGDSLKPAMEGLYVVLGDIVGGIARWAEENPGLVGGISAVVGSLAAAILVLTGYTAVVKKLTAAKAALGIASWAALGPFALVAGAVAAVAGVTVALAASQREARDEIRELSSASREQYFQLRDLEREYEAVSSALGGTSTEALLLRQEIDGLTAAFEENRMTSEEVAAAHRQAMEAYEDMRLRQARSRSDAENEGQGIMSLVGSLEELISAEQRSLAEKQKILGIVNLLNKAVPELGLAYDELGDSLNMSPESYRALGEAEAARRKKEAYFEGMIESTERQHALDMERAALEERLYSAVRLWDQARDEVRDYDRQSGGYRHRNYIQDRELAALKTARDAAAAEVMELNDMLAAAAEAAWDNKAWVDHYSGWLAAWGAEEAEAARTQEEHNRIILETGAAIEGVTDRAAALAEAYTAVYNAALSGVQGQHSLWDKVDEASAKSAEDMNAAIESQIVYMEAYNANIEGLIEKSSEIEGLSDMLSSFADGSQNSVNAIAGMAGASDEELRQLVDNWQHLQKMQELVAASLAELATDFTNAIQEMHDELNDAVLAMDLSDEAMTAGRDTILGFIEGAEGMLPDVVLAYQRIASAGFNGLMGVRARPDAYAAQPDPWRPRVDGSHSAGLPYVPFDGYVAELHKGEQVLTAEEAQSYSIHPKLASALSAMAAGRPGNALTAQPAGSGGVTIQITLAPEYHTTGVEEPSRLESVYAANNENLRELVRDVVEEQWIDAARGMFN